MTTAILFAMVATDQGTPACMLHCAGEPLLRRFDAQLHRLGVRDVHVLTRPRWGAALAGVAPRARLHFAQDIPHALDAIARIAAEGRGTLLLAHAETVTLDSVLAGLLADPRVPSGVVVGRRDLKACLPELRVVRGRVVAAASAFHPVDAPTHSFLGISKISDDQRLAVGAVARELAVLLASGPPRQWTDELARKAGRCPEPTLRALRDDPGSLLVTALVRRDVVLTCSYLRELFWDRPVTHREADTATQAVGDIDEDRHLLNSAVKASDGFFTTFFVSPYSKYIARWCARRGFTPNQVTTVSMLLGLLAALGFAMGTRGGLVAGAVLLQAAFTADCVDGQLARYTRQFSKLGAWLDSVFDRAKEYVVYAGLAFGATSVGMDASIWLLAAAALTLQTVRHSLDFSYGAQQHQELARSARRPLEQPGPIEGVERDRADALEYSPAGEPDAARRGSVLKMVARAGVALSVRLEKRPWMRWAKRILVLPIGERFALISVTAAMTNARTTFVALLIWGTVGASYSVTGRILRSFA